MGFFPKNAVLSGCLQYQHVRFGVVPRVQLRLATWYCAQKMSVYGVGDSGKRSWCSWTRLQVPCRMNFEVNRIDTIKLFTRWMFYCSKALRISVDDKGQCTTRDRSMHKTCSIHDGLARYTKTTTKTGRHVSGPDARDTNLTWDTNRCKYIYIGPVDPRQSTI